MLFIRTKVLFIFCVALLAGTQALSQGRKRHKHNPYRSQQMRAFVRDERLGITFGAGLSSYYGDLCDKYECMHFRPNIGIGAMLRMTPNIGIKAELNYFRLYSDDVWPQRNLDFRSNNAEFYAAAYYQIFPHTRYGKVRPWNAYGFAGLGLTYFSPQGSLNGKWYNLRPLQTEGVKYSPITGMIPFGAGFIFNITEEWGVILELGYRKTFTDRLDDVSSKEWKSQSSFSNSTAANISNKTGMGDAYWLKTGQYRGNPLKKDGYFIAQIKLKYTIVSKRTHYRLRRAPLRKRF